ncbi:MAG TPA: ABC transporter ATP-binding protein [Blautia sp.]|mgnify:FL=1|uniref:ABC transporter ATP-binding protein n=1 Tax=Blautia sp. TaxID=1955243 RepID=UPI000E88FE2B|nr:ABC transporter ATP-binding protein [Blautia sp.]HBB45330.1 ABC transporter ATP-binding protein [Blautia sp.]
MAEDIAISVNDVSKMYKLYDNPMDRLKESLGLSRKKKYKEHYALNHVSFQVHKGETVGIIGTNGSGKSTILKIITGVLSPTGGEVSVNGRISALLELGAGFNGEYSGLENVYLNGSMIGFSREEIDAKLQSILDFADIGEFIHQPVKTYSSGMFVRLAFAVAINIDPEILIVDEALSVGDVFFQAKCYRKFEEFKEMGKTILFVSHDLSSIGKYCDRVVLLNKGEKLAEGGAKEMVNLYRRVLVNQYDDADLEEGAENAEAGQDGQLTDGTAGENVSKKEHAGGGRAMKDSLNLNPKVLEYGSKLGEIEDFAIRDDTGMITNVIEKGKEFSVQMKVRFQADVNDPIFAFTLKDLKGTEITGTNTMYEHTPVKPQKAGDVREITFKQIMPLEAGEYMLCLGCTGYKDGDFTVFHRLYDVCNLTVITDKKAVGYFDMFSKVSVK